MNLTFEYFKEEVDDDLSFAIEKNNNKRKGFIDLIFEIDNKYFGEDE
jgi:hypothetical protein